MIGIFLIRGTLHFTSTGKNVCWMSKNSFTAVDWNINMRHRCNGRIQFWFVSWNLCL